MKSARIYFGILLLIFLILIGCAKTQQNKIGTNAEKIKVVATFYPLYDLAKKIAPNLIVDSIAPAGVEPHDYEPTPNDILKLRDAKAFVTIGFEFSGIENKLIQSQGEKMLLIDAKKGITLLDAEKQDDSKSENHGKDVHIWLSPNNMIAIANNIRDGLKNIDAANSKLYDENAKIVIEELKRLEHEYKTGLSKCRKNVILTNHRAFAYLGKDYGFSQIGISGIEPETEPTPKEIIKIKDAALKNNLKYVFSEELVDSRVAETIAKEIGAKTLVLNPIEGTKNPDEDYFSLMRQNLANLKLALECD